MLSLAVSAFLLVLAVFHMVASHKATDVQVSNTLLLSSTALLIAALKF